MAKIRNSEKEFFFDLNPVGGATVTGNAYIDLGQVYSLCNRVSMRQGYEWAITNIEIGVAAGGAFTASIFKLPSHWPLINGWEKTMRRWKEQQDESADEAGLESTRAAYRDFKVHFDEDHVAATFAQNLIPSGYSTTHPFSEYNWQASQVVLPNAGGPGVTGEMLLHMLGDDVAGPPGSAGIIKAYAESRSRPTQVDPNIVEAASGGLFGEMIDVGLDTGDIIENYQEHNHVPPYEIGVNSPEEFYPGATTQGIGPLDPGGNPVPGVLFDVLSINAGQNYNSDNSGGTTVPCGLLKLAWTASGVAKESPPSGFLPPTTLWMKITVAPGEYKGAAARSMVVAN